MPRAIPGWQAVLAARGAEWWAAATGRPPALTRATLAILECDWPLDSRRAVADLGYRDLPLAEGEEMFTVVSGAKGGDRLKEVLAVSDNVVLMKTYKHFAEILSQVEDAGLRDSCCFVSRCGLDGEIVERDYNLLQRIDQPNYLSLLILKRRGIE